MDVNFDLFDEEVRREIARRSLHEFIQYINPEYIISHFSETVCNALDQFLLDMMDGKRPKLILGAPPQHGKSDIVSRVTFQSISVVNTQICVSVRCRIPQI